MNGVGAFASWLVPYIALGGGVYVGLMTVSYIVVWVIDLRRDGPQVRKFQDLAGSIQWCKNYLLRHHDRPPTGEQQAARFGTINGAVGLLLKDLRQLRIAVPVFEHADNRDDVYFLISYLGSIEEFAKRGDLAEARGMDFTVKRCYDSRVEESEDLCT